MKPFNILHLSDAHIGHPLWKSDRRAVMRPLIDDIKAVAEGCPPDLFIFSGDLVYGEVAASTMEAQFVEARKWLEEIHQLWGVTLGDIPLLIVPGNHDIQRSRIDETQTGWLHSQTTPDALEKYMKTGATLWKRMLERQALWWEFVKSIPNQPWNYDDAIQLTSGVLSHDGTNIGFVGFNTSWSCCENREKGKLWFTRHQYQVGYEQVHSCPLRVAVLHHPVSWFHEHEESWLLQKFESNFHLLLHGHTHNGWYSHQKQHATVAAGACWAGSTEENGYYWIRLTPDPASIELQARLYIDKGAGLWAPANIPSKFSTHGTVRLPLASTPDYSLTEEAEVSKERGTEIVGTVDIASTFPEQHDQWVARPRELELLRESFEPSEHLVLVTGQEGVGKTILAAQFAQQFPTNSICIYLKPTPHWSTQLSYIRYDICNQAHWIVEGAEMEFGPVGDSTLTGLLHKVQRHHRTRKVPTYIVIDGLNQFTSPSSPSAICDVLSLFETFTQAFRFVICLDPEFLPGHFRALPYRTFRVPRFDRAQCDSFLEGVAADEQLQELWDLTRGHPATLASIRRILRRYPQTTTYRLSSHLPDLFNFEWSQVDESNSNQLLLLAALSLFPERFTKDSLTRVLNIPAPEVSYAVQNFGFLAATVGDKITFSSEPLRGFVARKLKRFEQSVRDSIIQDLMREPESSEALHEVPLYLSEAGRDSELLAYLSPDHLEKLLQQSQSWQQAIEKTSLALSIALKSESVREYSRFALHRSSLFQFQKHDSGRAETEALLALGRVSDAISFADSQLTRENRLLLLSVIARNAREKNVLLPTSVAESIQKLACDLPRTLGTEQRLELATELVYTYPDLAIRVVESLSDERENIDTALAGVSVRALLSRRTEAFLEDSVDDIAAKIGSDKARRFTTSAQLVLGRTTTSAALARVKSLSNSHDQIYLLRQWATTHPKTPDARPLVEYALDLIVKTTDYVPNARALRELASPLPFLEKDYAVVVLVGRFSDQLQLLKNHGFTEDYVHLQLTLAHTEASFAEPRFRERLTALYYYVTEIEDLSIRTSCLALLCGKVLEIESDPGIDEASRLYPGLIQDLEEAFGELLRTSADHYSAAMPAILQVHSFDSKRSISFAKQLNTEPRRNQAYADLALSEIKKSVPDAAVLKTVIQAITHRDLFENTVAKIASTIADGHESGASVAVVDLLVQLAPTVTSASKRTEVIKDLLRLGSDNSARVSSRERESLLGELQRSWELIDDRGAKREAGLQTVIALAETQPDVAMQYWTAVKDLESHAGISEIGTSSAMFHNILLSIRFFRGLLPRGAASTAERQAVLHQIDKLPSLAQRVHLLSELALAYFRHKKLQDGNAIVQDRIQPLLDQIAQKDRSLYERIFANIAPVLYTAHAPSTRQRLIGFDSYRRDLALQRICTYIFDKLPPDDPFASEEKHDYKLTNNELLELVELLGLAEDDSLVFWNLCRIVDCVSSARGRRTYTQQMNADLASQLLKLIGEKFPASRFIRHQGYAIAARAQIARFAGVRDDEFEKLISDARGLENVADRSYVLALIATSLSGARAAKARELLKEALDLIGDVSTYEDRVGRYMAIGELAVDTDKTITRDAFRRAVQYVGSVENWRSGAHARRLVDAAYRVDKNLAEEISVRLDSDPARAELPKATKLRSQRNDLREKILGGDPLEDVNLSELDVLNNVIWSLWGEVNAAKRQGLKLSRCRDLIHLSSRLPLLQAFSLWLFIAENLCTLYENTNQVDTFLRPLFDATLVNGELAFRIGSSAAPHISAGVNTSFEEFSSGITIIPAGARQRAIDEIEQWCSETVEDYVVIVDPTFRANDISLVDLVRRNIDGCHIIVLTSKSAQSVDSGADSVEESFKKQWRQAAGSADPSGVEIVLVGVGLTGELPISDRALISQKGGLWLGAGYSQLGVSKETRIRRISQEEAARIEAEADVFLDGRKARAASKQLSISRFTLL